MSLHPHSRVCWEVKQWGPVSAQQSLQFHTHPCTRPLEVLIHARLTFLSQSLPPSFAATLSPSSLCWCQAVKWMLAYFRAMLSNTLSLMCRPSPWLSAVQLGSGRDKRTKAISPATNNRFQSCTFVPFTSQIRGVIYIQKGKNPPHQRVLDLLMQDIYAADTHTKKRRDFEQIDRAATMTLPPHTVGTEQI